ncbi:hypothetical protein QVD17_18160 [Tagetes erecta]|uniref:Uncharacterized protein n=1 Tax=Tagetes erecta TaxID=13708 RepID=A0AAD8KK45_TARER|nr:hypothetical protein QVD17_18160 [Tagetes erecta]
MVETTVPPTRISRRAQKNVSGTNPVYPNRWHLHHFFAFKHHLTGDRSIGKQIFRPAKTPSTMAARQAANLLRLTSPRSASQAASFIQRRGLAGAADPHGTPKVDFWKDPMSPSKWKEEHFVIISLTGWGLLIYGGIKAFSGGKKDEKAVETGK